MKPSTRFRKPAESLSQFGLSYIVSDGSSRVFRRAPTSKAFGRLGESAANTRRSPRSVCRRFALGPLSTRILKQFGSVDLKANLPSVTGLPCPPMQSEFQIWAIGCKLGGTDPSIAQS